MPPADLREVVLVFVRLIAFILPVLESLALLAFIWGIIKFISRSSEQAIIDGKKLMVWGLIALFILFSFQAIILAVYRDVGFSRFGLPFLPTD